MGGGFETRPDGELRMVVGFFACFQINGSISIISCHVKEHTRHWTMESARAA